jgi:hypothetical protein
MQAHLRAELRKTGGNAYRSSLINDGKSKTSLLYEVIRQSLKEFGYGE